MQIWVLMGLFSHHFIAYFHLIFIYQFITLLHHFIFITELPTPPAPKKYPHFTEIIFADFGPFKGKFLYKRGSGPSTFWVVLQFRDIFRGDPNLRSLPPPNPLQSVFSVRKRGIFAQKRPFFVNFWGHFANNGGKGPFWTQNWAKSHKIIDFGGILG